MIENFVLIGQAATGAGAPSAGGGSMFGILGPVAIFAVMIFFLFRAQKKEAKKRKTMLEAIKAGDKVITGGGIYATIISVKDKSFIVKIAENVKIEINKAGVSSIIGPVETEADKDKSKK